jgi:hypothetical protein
MARLTRCASFVLMVASIAMTAAAQLTSGPARASGSGDGPGGSAVMDAAPAPVTPEVFCRDSQGRVTVRATRVIGRIVIDGRLDDTVYAQVEPLGDLVQQEPYEGQPSTVKTDV